MKSDSKSSAYKKKKRSYNRQVNILNTEFEFLNVRSNLLPSGKSLFASLDSSSRVTSTIACGSGFVNCSDKGVNTPMLMSTNLLSASLCTEIKIIAGNLS